MEALLMWAVFMIFSGILAHGKGRNVVLWCLAGLLFGPIGLLVGLLPVTAEKRAKDEIEIKNRLSDTENI